MLLIGSVNVVIFIMAVTITDMSYRLVLTIAGIFMFFTLTVRQGNKITRTSRAITIKNLPPERQKAAEEAYNVLNKKDEEKGS